jgi:ubiquinol-cytochrome c reductase iron-sulfur subunit
MSLSRISNSATTVVTGALKSTLRPIALKNVEEHHEHIAIPERIQSITNQSINGLLIKGNLKVKNAFASTQCVRYAHTDLKVPNFDDYRNSYSKDPTQLHKSNADDRYTYSYLTTFGAGLVTAYGAKAIITDIVANVAPSADVLALAKIEVNLNEIPEGKNVVVKWRSKPLFIRHRTQEEIERERKVDLAELRDPQTDDERIKKPEWLVILGVCTHLGKIK